jgi:MFS family permease
MKLKHKEHLNKTSLKYLYSASFFLGIASAFVLYLESDYIKTAVGSDNITLFYIVAYSITLILISSWHHLIRIYGKSKIFLISLSLKGGIILALAVSPVNKYSAWLMAAYMISAALTWLDFDIMLENFSADKVTGRIRGLYLTITSAGYVLSPIAAGLLVSRYGFQASFKASFVFFIPILIIAFWKFRNINHEAIIKINFADVLRKIIKRRNVMKIYYISFLLQFFYALIIIYTPLRLLELGFSWTDMGKMFTLMLIPFIIIEYPIGYFCDKKFEERNILPFALLIISLSAGAMTFINSKSFIAWAGILFCTRIGASLVEVLRDSYFYKRIDRRDVDIIDFFRNVTPLSYIIGAVIAAPIVYFFQIKAIFIIIGILLLTGIPVSFVLAPCRILPNSSRKSSSAKK